MKVETSPKDTKETLRKKAKEVYLLSLKQGSSHKEATEATGYDVTTIWDWRQKDKQFSLDILSALDSRIKVVEDALYATATGKEGKAKVIAQIFWLKNRGKNWKDKQDVTFIAPTIVKQNTFIQAGEEPKVIEELTEEDEKKSQAYMKEEEREHKAEIEYEASQKETPSEEVKVVSKL